MANEFSDSATSSSSFMATRSAVNCPIFGEPSELPDNVLPTREQVSKFYSYVRFNKKESRKEPTFAEISEEIAVKLEYVWNKASIPIVSHKRILQLLKAYHDKYQKLMKPFKSRKNVETYKLQIQKFKEESRSTLFDIAACKCDLSISNACCCDKTRKVPKNERDFLRDQRTTRKMLIGGIDVIQTKKNIRKLHRNNWKSTGKMASHFASPKKSEISEDDETFPSLSSDSDFSCDEAPLSSSSKTDDVVTQKTNQMRDKLPTFAEMCDRYAVSDRCASALASSVLHDIGIIKEEDTSRVVDRCKVRRERKRCRSEVRIRMQRDVVKLCGLYFDGRKDKTLVQVKKGDKYYRQSVIEEHVTLMKEPECNYFGHVIPASGTAASIKQSIVKFLEENSVDTSNLEAIGCDGTVVNTGIRGGIIRLLEKHFQKPLQWFICQLHGNELPLRHLFFHLDGETHGPSAFVGPIGKQLQSCEKLHVVVFNEVKGNLPAIPASIMKDLSADQRYLFDICQAIDNGKCSIDLSNRYPGKMSHSRWITLANRVLRLYISTKTPSPQLCTLTKYIMTVYAPLWFEIKRNSSCKDGAKHLFRLIQLSRYLDKELRDIVDSVVQRNAYFGHPENILLCMISDDRKHIRDLGLRRILKSRSAAASSSSSKIRMFEIPPLNFEATEYFDMIDWQKCNITEPPITSRISNEDLQKFINSCDTITFGKYPCHTQCVERCIKLVSEASAAVCGYEQRDGFIRVRVNSRDAMPVFNTKKEFLATNV